MSDTPRTDAEFEKAPRADYGGMTHMTVFARQLERELNSTKKEVSDWVFNANELQKGYNKLDSKAQELKSELKEAKSEQENVINGITYDLTVKCDSLRRQNERLTSERDVLKIEYECRAEWIAKMVKILGCENKDGFNCKDAHWTAEELVRQNERLREALQSSPKQRNWNDHDLNH